MEVQGWQSPRISISDSINGSNGTNNAPSSPSKPNHPCASPEFEFWMVRNPAFPTPNLLSADQLFVDGVLLPLQNLQTQDQEEDEREPVTLLEIGESSCAPLTDAGKASNWSATLTSSSPSASKRWKDIFRMGEKKLPVKREEKEKKKKRKKSTAELNINIWPFSRSRSAGTSSRPRACAAGGRKAASAPCSRSNSTGESKTKLQMEPCSRSNSTGESKTKLQMEVEYRPLIQQEDGAKGGATVGRGGGRRWASSPVRPGVYLGRSSPIRPLRRPGSATKKLDRYVSGQEKVHRGSNTGGRPRVLNVNVPLCMGYAQHLGCKSMEMNGGGIGTNKCSNAATSTTTSATTNPLFNLRALFSRKVY